MSQTEPVAPSADVDIDLVELEQRPHPGITDFLTWLTVERGRSTNTLTAYRRDLGRYQQHLANRGADPMTAMPDDVLAFVHVLQGEGLAPSSVTRAEFEISVTPGSSGSSTRNASA